MFMNVLIQDFSYLNLNHSKFRPYFYYQMYPQMTHLFPRSIERVSLKGTVKYIVLLL